MIEFTWHPSPNFTQGRSGYSPIAIVNHVTAGSFPGCLTWLCNPTSSASSHYLVTKAGAIYQMVRDEDMAWGNGTVNRATWPLLKQGVNPNLYTLSIEHEGQTGEPLTAEQYKATLGLHQMLCMKWRIPADRGHIIGHYEIDAVNRPNCPGSAFPWDYLIADLNKKEPEPVENPKIFLEGEPVEIATKLEGGKTFVHIRIAEQLGYSVHWDGEGKIVYLEREVSAEALALAAKIEEMRSAIKDFSAALDELEREY